MSRKYHRAGSGGVLALVVCGVFLCAAAPRQSDWEIANQAGLDALRAGRHAEAEKQFDLAVKEAEGFGAADPRLATCLNNLASLYDTQGKYAQAEPLYTRALAIREKALGADHVDVAVTLNNLADLYRLQGKFAAAEPLFKRCWPSRKRPLALSMPISPPP